MQESKERELQYLLETPTRTDTPNVPGFINKTAGKLAGVVLYSLEESLGFGESFRLV